MRLFEFIYKTYDVLLQCCDIILHFRLLFISHSDWVCDPGNVGMERPIEGRKMKSSLLLQGHERE